MVSIAPRFGDCLSCYRPSLVFRRNRVMTLYQESAIGSVVSGSVLVPETAGADAARAERESPLGVAAGILEGIPLWCGFWIASAMRRVSTVVVVLDAGYHCGICGVYRAPMRAMSAASPSSPRRSLS